MFAGQLDRRITFRRRAPGATVRDRGAWQDHATMWGNYLRLSGRQAMEAGRETNVEQGTLLVRWPGPGDDVTVADRVVIDGRERAISAVATPERRAGYLEFTVTTDVQS